MNLPSDTDRVKTTIVIPVFNQLHYTQACVDSLNRAGVMDAQIIIVNNGSTDGTREFLAAHPAICAIHNEKNLGCGTAWTQGAQASKSIWTVISNNDVLFAPDTLSGLIRFAEAHHADIASPATCEGEADYDFPAYAASFMRTMSAVVRWNVASGSCFMVHRRVFESIGYFRSFGLGGYEDDDYFRRARQAGFRLAITGRAYCHHFGGTTQKSIKASLNQPEMYLADRTDYRRKTGLTWSRRKWGQVTRLVKGNWWKISERLRYGRTLHETRIVGKWGYR